MCRKIFIFGFGYTASCLANNLAALGFHITGTTRNSDSDHKAGYELVGFTAADVEMQLQSATHVLISVPPSVAEGDLVLAHFGMLLQKYASQIQWLGYLSSTGVYGDHHGAWVDESSASVLPGKSGQLRLEAEAAWFAAAKVCQLPLHIFRLAGIYGPDRSALTRVALGKTQTIYKEGHFFSRIHVEDIAAVLVASIHNPNPGSTYNVADDEPAPAYDIDEYAASLLQLPALQRVPFEFASLSPMAREFYTYHRRVSSAKIKQELAITLNYPTYREGLKKIYEDGDY